MLNQQNIYELYPDRTVYENATYNKLLKGLWNSHILFKGLWNFHISFKSLSWLDIFKNGLSRLDVFKKFLWNFEKRSITSELLLKDLLLY